MGVFYNPSIITEGLVFSLDVANSKCYSGSGTTVNGMVKTIPGVLNNGVGYSSTNSGSFTFDGTNDFVSFNIDPVFNFGTGDFTVLAWHKTSNKSNYSTVLQLDDGNGTGILFYTTISSGVFRNWVAGQPRNGTIDICTGQWVQLGLTRSSGLCTQFVNSVSDVTFAAAGSVATSTRPLVLGQNANSYFYNGNISQVQFYNRALSAQEILQNYNATKGRYL